MKHSVIFGLADLALLITAFFLVHLLNYGHLAVSGTNYNLLQLQILVWLPISLISRKLTRLPGLSVISGWVLCSKAG